VDVVDAAVEDGQELAELGAHLRVCPQEIDGVLDRAPFGEDPVGNGGNKHVNEPALPLGHVGHGWRDCSAKHPPIGTDALLVIDVEQAAEGAPEDRLLRAGREYRRAGSFEQIRPALAAVVDIVEVKP
jgi:hypothetical protein